MLLVCRRQKYCNGLINAVMSAAVKDVSETVVACQDVVEMLQAFDLLWTCCTV